MTPGTPTGLHNPPESSENEQKTPMKLSKGEQVLELQKQCRNIQSDPEVEKVIKKYQRKTASKEELKEIFTKKLSSMSPAVRSKIGINDAGSIENFITSTCCFENQFLYEIQRDTTLKSIVREELIDGCVISTAREYGLNKVQKDTLRIALSDEKNENIDSLKVILESPKLRKKRVKKYLKEEVQIIKIEDQIDLQFLHNQIINKLDPTHSETKKIQSAWLAMISGIRGEGQEGIKSTDFEAFFASQDTLIPKKTKETLLSFMMRQYLPYITPDELESVSPKAHQEWISARSAKIEHHADVVTLGGDSEWNEALKKIREEHKKNSVIFSGSYLPTCHLDFSTQIRLLSQFGVKNRQKQMQDFLQGHPGAIPTGPEYEKKFLEQYGFRPKHVGTQSGLTKKLENYFGDRMKGVEHFAPGTMMTWKTKGQDGKDLIGYYAIDEILSEDAHDDSLVKIRFLGNNTEEYDDSGKPVRPKIALLGGKKMLYSGSRFFEYMASIVDDGEVDFVPASDIQERLTSDKVETYTDEDVRGELLSRFDGAEIMSEASLNKELDILLQDDVGRPLEDTNPENRKIKEQMSFTIQTESGMDTFEIEEIIPGENGELPKIRLWDGWGKKKKNKNEKDDSRGEYTFLQFLNLLKFLKKEKTVYRVPNGSGKRFGIDQFNTLMKSEKHTFQGKHKKYSTFSIEPDPKNKDNMTLGETDKNGNFHGHNIIKVGAKKDICIDSIDGETVTVRMGTFADLKTNDKGGIKKQASFTGSGPEVMPLSWLWSYIQSHDSTLTSPPPKGKKYFEKQEDKGGSMSWWNIFKHAHSMGTILHGDLWKAPWKAFEEQHHKDHAFAGKITAALAVEKAQKIGGGIGNWLFDYDWANLMVADANSSFQSYLDELVNKIDGMGSYHRTRLIKKWSKLHFPDPKFMAAMFASMKIFGQLYPYDSSESDYQTGDDQKSKQKSQWFWYNSITHTHAVTIPAGWPSHMPPHGDDKWPERNGQQVGEIEACHSLIASFQHPLLKNLGRRYQKYMSGSHDDLLNGGKSNMEERTTMQGKRDWLEDAILDGKPTEAFGVATDLWLAEGYPTAVSTRPYALMMMGCVEQQILPKSQEYLKDLFQKGNHVPMFAFAQSKNLGDTFRETMITFAYTMGEDVGDELSNIIKEANSNRVTGRFKAAKEWRTKASNFWDKNGKILMHKMTGMRDPMLNLLINAPDTFDAAYEHMPENHKKRYERLKKGSYGRNKVVAYHKRLAEVYDNPKHVSMPRGGAFYGGDHFRFRDGFDIGYPMAWVNWDAYWDANMDEGYASGGKPTDGDGIFNEIRGFLYKIPEMAKEMVKQMGISKEPERQNLINNISKDIYEKNIEPMSRLAKQKIKATNPEAEYCSMTAMMFEMIPVQELTVGGSRTKAQERYTRYKEQMFATLRRAKEIEKSDGFTAGIAYRAKMATLWSKIVREQIDTGGKTIEHVEKIGGSEKRSITPTQAIIEDKHHKTMQVLQKKHTNSPLSHHSYGEKRNIPVISEENAAEAILDPETKEAA